jgi:hypothetical protein
MLNGLAPLTHCLRIGIEAPLHGFEHAGAGTTNRGLYFTGNGGTLSTNHAIYSDSAASSYLLGNLGIGAATPAVSLTVIGEVQVSSSGIACSSAATGAIPYVSGTGVQVCNSAAWTTLAAGSGASGTGSATSVAFWNGASSLTYDSDGFYWDATNNRLGIGTNSPCAVLHVANGSAGTQPTWNATDAMIVEGASGANTSLHILAASNKQSQLMFSNNTTRGAGSIVYNHATGFMSFAVSGTGAMVLSASTNAANVGINNSAPTSALQVSGTFVVSTSAGFRPACRQWCRLLRQ